MVAITTLIVGGLVVAGLFGVGYTTQQVGSTAEKVKETFGQIPLVPIALMGVGGVLATRKGKEKYLGYGLMGLGVITLAKEQLFGNGVDQARSEDPDVYPRAISKPDWYETITNVSDPYNVTEERTTTPEGKEWVCKTQNRKVQTAYGQVEVVEQVCDWA